jgi:hypothetical protein
MRLHTIAIISLTLILANEGYAGIGLFKRPPKPDPAEHVPALIKTLKTDPEDRKRASAAEELRDYDAKAFPEIIPALIEALQNDSSISVRLEVVTTIGKIRPISQTAGYALEQAAHGDSALRVRGLAKTVLWDWRVFHGYRSGKPPANQPMQTEEPPLAPPLPGSKIGNDGPTLSPMIGGADQANPPRRQPPLMPSQNMSSSRPKSLFPLLPTKTSKPGTKPDEGPSLDPPM